MLQGTAMRLDPPLLLFSIWSLLILLGARLLDGWHRACDWLFDQLGRACSYPPAKLAGFFCDLCRPILKWRSPSPPKKSWNQSSLLATKKERKLQSFILSALEKLCRGPKAPSTEGKERKSFNHNGIPISPLKKGEIHRRCRCLDPLIVPEWSWSCFLILKG